MNSGTDILAFGAHPDDVELGCGGILARAHAQGLSIAIADLTLGEKGTHGSKEIRRAEAMRAAAVIGAERVFLNFSDCEVVDSYEGRLELVRVIRHFRPRLILAPYWRGERNHPDHRACGLMARRASRFARLAKVLPDLATHTVGNVLHYLFPWEEGADFLVDIAPYLAFWQEMIQAHESQLHTRPYLEWCLRTASRLGLFLGTDFAQGLVQSHPLEISDLGVLAQGAQEL